MGASSMIFYLFMFTFLAALVYAGFQVFKTTKSQERHGDDKKALTHKLEREQAAVETERAQQPATSDRSGDPLGDDTRARQNRLADKQAEAEVARERHTGAVGAS
jgi:hypothetical protein